MKPRFLSFALLVLPLTVPLVVCHRPHIIFSTRSLTFAPQVIDPSGGRSASQGIVVSNNGSASGFLSPFTASGSYFLTTGCGSSLAAGASCTIDVTFGPNQVGALNGQVLQGGVPIVSLTGIGLAPVGFSPESLDFGTVAIGSASTAQTVTLTNNQGSALNISGIAASGNYAQTNNCTASLAAGATCTINVMFQPTAKGAIPGAITVTSDAVLLDGGHDFGRELRVAVEDQELVWNLELPCLSQLQHGPESSRILGDVAMKDGASVVTDHEEAVKDSEGQCGNREQVHCGNGIAVIPKERQPLLSWAGPNLVLLHPTGHGTFRDVETQHLQFAMNARCSPGGILSDHATNQLPNVSSHGSASDARLVFR